MRTRPGRGGDPNGHGGDWVLAVSLVAILICCLGPLLAGVSLGAVALLWDNTYVQAVAVALAAFFVYRALRRGRKGL